MAPPLDNTLTGKQIVPAGKLGSNPPAMPQLTKAVAPASMSARAAAAAATPPMPLTATRVPSGMAKGPLARGGDPNVRASAMSAATTPALNA